MQIKSTENMNIKMTEKEKSLIDCLMIDTENETISNRFSGASVSLVPEAVAIYDLVIGSEYLLSKNPNDDKTYEVFHAGRDIFRRNWPKEYMILLD